MIDIRTTLRDAIAKASSDEMDIAGKLARAVLEREHDAAISASTWAEEVARQEETLLAKQRTVDVLKLALSRLPDATQTY